MTIETKPDAAKAIWQLASYTAQVAGDAATQVSGDNLQFAIQDAPRYCKQLIDEVSRLQIKGWDGDVLGPVIFDLVDGDHNRSWEIDYSAKYNLFKTAVFEYWTFVTGVNDWGTVSIGSDDGRPVMNLTATAQQKTDLQTKLQAIADNLPTVGG